MAKTTTYIAEFADGTVCERRSRHEPPHYAWAASRSGTVTFHGTREAAARQAGSSGEVVPVYVKPKAQRSHSTQPLEPVLKHIRVGDPFGELHADKTPVIRQAFRPGDGWKQYPFQKRISRAWAQKMKGEGYTSVSLEIFPGRLADFTLKELTYTPSPSMKTPARAGTR